MLPSPRALRSQVEHAVRQRMRLGQAGRTAGIELARSEGWIAHDVVCTSGPRDRSFEEQHSAVSVALVLAGTFQYRAGSTRDTLVPGSVLLGNPGQSFECGHEHAAGDRCLAFTFHPEYFERVAFDASGSREGGFRVGRLPPLGELSGISVRAATGVLDPAGVAWEELALEVAARVSALANGVPAVSSPPIGAESRVTASVRAIERDPAARHPLDRLAREAGLSPYHYLRVFQRATGVTPHQFILRTRLREAAARLVVGDARVIEIALEAGFSDLSTFNRGFRSEFGMSPRDYRRVHRRS
jgi:AraC-like DNA-binding protein